MRRFQAVYVPVGVPTFHLESAKAQFENSAALLKGIEPDVVCPEEMLLSVERLSGYLDAVSPDLIVFQNLTFANAAYMAEVKRRFSCPLLLWTLREPVIDGGRLRLNSLTGAFSAANTLMGFGDDRFGYVFGAPEEERVQTCVRSFIQAARLRSAMGSLRMAAVGHTPQGFGFGRALDHELMSVFGAELLTVEVRELIDRAKGYSEEDCRDYLLKTEQAVRGFGATPEKNRLDHARLYKAYSDFVRENRVSALASRCWPDLFTAFGTPVCTVLSLLNDDGVAAACEADIYGALSMWLGMELSGAPVFFGDPVSLDEEENTLTFWHCGAAACSLARKDTGAAVGVHPNRKLGPTMDFGCEAWPQVTVFRVGRKPDGSFRFLILEGEALDKPRQFSGTSVVVRTGGPCREIMEQGVLAGLEPHFAVVRGHHAAALSALGRMLGVELLRF